MLLYYTWYLLNIPFGISFGNYGPRYSVLELQFTICAQNLVFKEMVVLLRPHTCDPVRGFMTTFERLHTVSEESAEQMVGKEPGQTMRVTRTKTRAMSKAAAAAAAAAVESASTSQESDISTDLPNVS
jgi:hypothetical protein